MKIFFNYLFIGLKYLLLQGFVEIILIVLAEYLGVKVLHDFSKHNLFIENIQGVAWEIFMKSIMFSLIYIPLFVGGCALLGWKKSKSSFIYAVINALLSFSLSVIFLLLLRQADFSEVLNLLIATVLSSVLILIIAKIIDHRKHQA